MYSIVRTLQNQFSASLDSFLLQSDIGRKTVKEKKNRGPGEEEEAAASFASVMDKIKMEVFSRVL